MVRGTRAASYTYLTTVYTTLGILANRDAWGGILFGKEMPSVRGRRASRGLAQNLILGA
jgi:hypothetical protein